MTVGSSRRRPRPRVFAAILILATAGCQGDGEVPVARRELVELEADQVMADVEHSMTRDGVRRAHLEADTAYLKNKASTVHFRHYTVDFFGPEGQQRSTLSAVDGLYNMETGDMEAREDVVVVDPSESQRLSTERLVYDASRNRLKSDVDFVMVRGRDTIRGTGFVTDPGLDSLTTTRPSVVSPPERTGGRGSTPPASQAPDTSGGGGAPPEDTTSATGDTSAGHPRPSGLPAVPGRGAPGPSPPGS